MDDHRREALLKEYSEVSNNFRLLTDIRFKLLAFLPIVTAAAAALKSESFGIGSFALSLFGLVATIGLVTYNARNDQLYNALRGRAASIERSLGLPDGAFASRPHPWLTIKLPGVDWKVDHGRGVGIIYAASISLWLFGLLVPVLELARRTYLHLGLWHFAVSDPLAWVQVTALILAVLGTYVAAKLITAKRKRRAKEMRSLASLAVEKARPFDLSATAEDDELAGLCAKLCGETAETIRARASFLATIDPKSLAHYLPTGSREHVASQLVALLTDLPPGWLFDCATNRRGRTAPQLRILTGVNSNPK